MGNDRLLRFGIFEFDPSGLQLCKAQRPVRLRPQALKLLRIFVSHPRQLITRDTIHQELWGSDVHVDFEQRVNHTTSSSGPRSETTRMRRGTLAVDSRYALAHAGLAQSQRASVHTLCR